MREQQRRAALDQHAGRQSAAAGRGRRLGGGPLGIDDADQNVGQGDSRKLADPVFVGRERHQRGPRRPDRVAQRGEPGVTIARRAAAGITLAADRDQEFLAGERFAAR